MAKKIVIDREKNYAILTGDIVGSSELSTAQRKKLLTALIDTSKEVRKLYKDVIPFDADIFRGDSWQLLIQDPSLSLRIALLFRSILKGKMNLRKFDSKIFIGIGNIDALPDKRVSLGSGQAFVLSGRGLEKLKNYRMGINFPAFSKNDYLKLVVRLVDVFVSNWTVKQSLAISGALKGWSQQKIAESWIDDKLTQQAVHKHLLSGFWLPIEEVLEQIENNT